MGNEDRDGVLVDAAEAVTLDQGVQWDRCAKRLARPTDRRSLNNLRAISRVFAGCHAAAGGSPSRAATGSAPFRSALVRRAVHALIAFAAVEVAAALLLLPWAWADYRRVYGDPAFWPAAMLVGYAAAACLFLAGGRRDRRIWLLGAYCLVKATLVNPFAMLASLRGAPQEELLGYPYVYPFLFAPVFLWVFARECPAVHLRTRFDDLARRMVWISGLLGCVLWVGRAASLELARAAWVDAAVFRAVSDGSLAALSLSTLAAVVVIVLRTRSALAEEARPVVLFGSGLLLCLGLATAYDVVEVFSPGDRPSDYRLSPAVAVVELIRFPGIVLLWYSVMVVHVPHLRETVRAFYRRLLVRGRLLAAAAATPVLALGWLITSRPEREVGAVIADPLVQWLFAAAGMLLLLVAGRERILICLDAWVHPEPTDQRQSLADAAAALTQAGRIATVRRTVARTVKRGCGSPATLLIGAETGTDGHDFAGPDASIAPLARDSAIVHMLDTAGGALRVHPGDPGSIFMLLPPDEAAWVVATGADAIVSVPGPGAEAIGVLVVGRRFDDRVVRSVDIPFLEALGAAAGLAVARLRLLHGPGNRSLEVPPAYECPQCRCVTGPGERPGCECGAEYVETDVPELLAGKFRLQRRLGAGGMGAVYLARDLRLERDVAVKTLTGMSVLRLMGMRPEAWAMATVTHPAVAQIYGIESWRDRPFLVVEFLAGGTLADRLRRGPLPAQRAVSVVAALADALAALHEAGYLHGDVKPSNIGFTPKGAPKLLDFGLARETDDTAGGGGTLRYLSPDVLSGHPADEADDVWSLCVVLYEMVSGGHPFAGGGTGEVADRIRRRRPGRDVLAAAGSKAPSAVTAFAASILMAPRSARPATAPAFADALHRVVAES